MFSEPLAGGLAIVAGHCESPLSSQPTCRIMKLRDSLRLRLRWFQALSLFAQRQGCLELRVVVYSASVSAYGGGLIPILSGGAGRIRTDVSGQGVPFQGDW